ncbi:MAG: S-layer homology domain-containing protein, partial [Firmicutes bacterium]|nr:S-layer homology domain-containing protein [Bacillota bacterium]
MKKTVSLFLTFALLLAAAIPAFAASGSMKNFEKKFTYEGQFEDVAANAWYAPYVAAAFEYGFVSGNSETTYNPDGNITLAETLVIADQIHSIYYGADVDRTPDGPWYTPYVKYAQSSGIIAEGTY